MSSPRPYSRLLGALALAAALLAPASAFAGSLLALDFETALPSGVTTTDGLGTVDTFIGSPGRALSAAGRVSTGRIAISNTVGDLAKLTVGFDVHVATLAPVRVTLASFDATGRRTGARTALVVPPVASSFYRFSLDLDKTENLDGAFYPLAPSIEFTFAAESAADVALRIDNLSYTAPSFYVSPTGSDSADGRTAATAFATPQRAADAARPGDVILLMDGTYVSPGHPDISDVPADTINSPLWRPWWVEKTGGNLTIKNAGTPAAWIVLRAHPGHRPVLFNAEGWHGVRFGLTSAYVEVRGLTIQGNAPKLDLAEATADAARFEKDGLLYHGAARFNANGILADGRAEKGSGPRPHHLRIIDNTLLENSGAGVTLIGVEHVTIEGNVSHDNCHFMRYGSSGLSTLLTWNWDAGTGHKIFFVRNTSHGNRTDVPCSIVEHDENGKPLPRRLTDKFSDGNGIIIDVNQNNAKSVHVPYPPYHARTLVQNNLVFNNGGSGIHTVSSDHVDILHNTAYLNSASPHIEYSQIYTYASDDVRITHNILVAP
ncbi:MAG: right-handed parallel beta-helix repeat-containing protein, partial [Burkholderiales bacterium]|nr:right-handed parallel beta-helix repeat-containing protein [Opitutaceae bacterium]